MINEATWQYIEGHLHEDVRQLALRGWKDEAVDLPMALQQIQGRQLAEAKLPTWAAVKRLVYPPHLSLEQCSSELTARYKAGVASSLEGDKDLMVDLTGGLGVDFYWMSKVFGHAVYVEQQPQLHDIAKANFAILGLQAGTVLGEATDYLRRMDHASVIFVDPARRNAAGGRTYDISDCSPNVLLMLDDLLSKGSHVMLKLSPMLDWQKAVSDVGKGHVRQVHIVSVRNDCKELLLVLDAHSDGDTRLFCVNDDSCEEFILTGHHTDGQQAYWKEELEGAWLYEPNASLMKAGLFDELAHRYHVLPLARNSHLFLSKQTVGNFPGRCFRIFAVAKMNKRELRQTIMPLCQANISVRNFPMTVAELRLRLKLREGGSNYLFATTLAYGEKVLIVARR